MNLTPTMAIFLALIIPLIMIQTPVSVVCKMGVASALIKNQYEAEL